MSRASPFITTYWVEPGFFLAGAHPIAVSKNISLRQALQHLLRIPLVTFIDLTTPKETKSYEMAFQEEAVDSDPRGAYYRMAIEDNAIPTVTQMQNILNIIDRSLASHLGVYLHCFSGIGRTGTVVGCYLVRHGQPGSIVLDTLAQLRHETLDAGLVAPRTVEQRDFVREWSKGM